MNTVHDNIERSASMMHDRLKDVKRRLEFATTRLDRYTVLMQRSSTNDLEPRKKARLVRRYSAAQNDVEKLTNELNELLVAARDMAY